MCQVQSYLTAQTHMQSSWSISLRFTSVLYSWCFEMGAMDAWCFALHLQHTPCQGSLGLQWACQLVLPLYHVAKGSQLEETKHVLTVSQLPKPESEI
jgi:hypothetical protein